MTKCMFGMINNLSTCNDMRIRRNFGWVAVRISGKMRHNGSMLPLTGLNWDIRFAIEEELSWVED